MAEKKAAGGGWNAFWGKVKPGMEKTGSVFGGIGTWIYRLRKFLLAAPVVYLAIRLAIYTSAQLPEQVGVFIQSNGQYAMTIPRSLAVYGPLGVTGICLVLMFSSRRTVYPWLISLFSLALPLFMLVCTLFPA